MVRVKGRGGFVDVEIQGINQVMQRIQKNENRIFTATSIEMVRQANFLQNEVQESIIGNKAEPKSVDTGKLGNSIDIKLEGKKSAVIFPSKRKYANTNTTTADVANFLEFGTSKIKPRRHFRNTKARNERKVVNAFRGKIKLAVK